MAVEVDNHDYLFCEDPQQDERLLEALRRTGIEVGMELECNEVLEQAPTPIEDSKSRSCPDEPDFSAQESGKVIPAHWVTPKAQIPFKHKPLHDLESAFWTGLHALICSDLVPIPSVSEGIWKLHVKESAKQVALLSNRASRASMLASDAPYTMQFLENTALLPQVRRALKQLGLMRKVLQKCYLEAESDLFGAGFVFEVDQKIYNFIISLLHDIAKSLEGDKDLKIRVHGFAEQKAAMDAELERQRNTQPNQKRPASSNQSQSSEEDSDTEMPPKAPKRSRKVPSAPDPDSIAVTRARRGSSVKNMRMIGR